MLNHYKDVEFFNGFVGLEAYLEGIRVVNPATNVHYFAGNSYELTAISERERLVGSLLRTADLLIDATSAVLKVYKKEQTKFSFSVSLFLEMNRLKLALQEEDLYSNEMEATLLWASKLITEQMFVFITNVPKTSKLKLRKLLKEEEIFGLSR